MKNKQTFRLRSRQAGNGAVIAIVLIVIVFILGGLYMWSQSRSASTPNNETATTTADITEDQIMSDQQASATEAMMRNQSSSDDVASIDRDLSATSYNSL